MANHLFNRFGAPQPQNNGLVGLLTQYRQLQNNPGYILDILLNNGKINQMQYNELQKYKNNPVQIAQYLINNGNAQGLRNAENLINNM